MTSRTAILSEVVAVRHERELARAAAATALTNNMGGYWRHRADGHNLTLRSLLRVLGDIREGTARQAATELDAAKVFNWPSDMSGSPNKTASALRLDKLRADWQEEMERIDEYADWTEPELRETFSG